jgi:hypothetical protein
VKKSVSSSKLRRGRLVGSALIFAVLAGVVLYFARMGNSPYPKWFVPLVLALIAANLLNWIAETGRDPDQVRCQRCGRTRQAFGARPCPKCGAPWRMAWVNRFAIGLIIAFFAVMVGAAIWTLQQANRDSDQEHIIGARVLAFAAIILSAGFVVELLGYPITDRLNDIFGRWFPYRFHRDVMRLKLRRDWAIRAIVLLCSLAILLAAVAFILSVPPRS